MKWGKKRPGAEGWWWFRSSDKRTSIAWVYKESGEWWADFGDRNYNVREFTLKCSWAGPIPEPKESP